MAFMAAGEAEADFARRLGGRVRKVVRAVLDTAAFSTLPGGSPGRGGEVLQ
jgi:hypothetical protein